MDPEISELVVSLGDFHFATGEGQIVSDRAGGDESRSSLAMEN
jgi:hypothetical protein